MVFAVSGIWCCFCHSCCVGRFDLFDVIAILDVLVFMFPGDVVCVYPLFHVRGVDILGISQL